MMIDILRHHRTHTHLHGAFGSGSFGILAERFARFFGTPTFIIIQTLIVIVWIILNVVSWCFHFDPYPFIFLNLAFSTQAAYAAPLILLAQTRQADRDKAAETADAKHREDIASIQNENQKLIIQMIEQNTELTRRIDMLTTEVHKHIWKS